MLSDAGYGLLLALGAWLLIKKCTPEKSMENTLRLFIYCGISTVIWGIIFGSFFGGASSSRQRRNGPQKGEDIEIDITINFE